MADEATGRVGEGEAGRRRRERHAQGHDQHELGDEPALVEGVDMDRQDQAQQPDDDHRRGEDDGPRAVLALGELATANIVIEAIPEDLELKRDAVRQLDGLRPDGTRVVVRATRYSADQLGRAVVEARRAIRRGSIPARPRIQPPWENGWAAKPTPPRA